MEKNQLLKILKELTDGDFEELISLLDVPIGSIPSPQKPRTSRAIDLLNWATSPTGCTLEKVEQELREMGAISQGVTVDSNPASNSPRISQIHSGSGDNIGGNKTVNNDNRQISVGKNYIENLQGTYIESQNNYSNSPNTETTQATKTIKIFLASSSELKSDRDQFEQFIYRETSNKYIDEGIFLKLVMWEDFIDAMSQTRLQDEYNKAISECDIFVSLFYTKVGKYTEEEFLKALETFKANDKPKIYTYFKNAPINTGEINEQILTLLNFKKNLSDLGHFFTQYSDINDLKYQFSQQLIKILPEILKNYK